MELILGSGNFPKKRLWFADNPTWSNPRTLDIDPNCKPDILWDLNQRPLPFEDNTFDEIHAYDVLEHLGKQGDWRQFFEEFSEYYRIIKDGGHMFILVPMSNSIWAWGDPGHTRVLTAETFGFLDQDIYQEVGSSPRTDYRFVWKGCFKIIHNQPTEHTLQIIMKAVKQDAN
jgi:ubiquinone/menaquinone biosynthesis C-methylase UbiE